MSRGLIMFILINVKFNINLSYVLSPGIKASMTDTILYSTNGEIFYNYNNFFIFPGTKWCGAGDIAENKDDLGFFEETDKCCRTHDYCNDYILARNSKHGLTNNGLFTKLTCECDYNLYNCLHELGPCLSASILGETYFNALDAKCFNYTYPANCVKHAKILWFDGKCLQYKFDEEKPKIWQWFDTPLWKRENFPLQFY